jgi:hypothetical protein
VLFRRRKRILFSYEPLVRVKKRGTYINLNRTSNNDILNGTSEVEEDDKEELDERIERTALDDDLERLHELFGRLGLELAAFTGDGPDPPDDQSGHEDVENE